MTLTIELPLPINEELAHESQREGVSEMEHAALLLCLASAFKQEEPITPFQNAVRVFLSRHSVDAARVFSAFEELVRVCLDVHDPGKASQAFQAELTASGSQREYDFLKHWRSSIVHQPVVDHPRDVSPDLIFSSHPSLDSTEQAQGRIARDSASDEEITDPTEHVRALLIQWQSEDKTPLRPLIPTQTGETPTQALFRKWNEEDANMSDEERDAEDRLWEDIEQSLKENGRELRLRRLGR